MAPQRDVFLHELRVGCRRRSSAFTTSMITSTATAKATPRSRFNALSEVVAKNACTLGV